MKLLIATGNQHKLEEIRGLFHVEGVELIGLTDLEGDVPDIEETGLTFESNAILKAAGLATFANMWALADDSGIEVDALDGAPGIYSARYAGVHGDDSANNRKLLADMEGQPNRSSRFRCAIALSDPQGNSETVSGAVEGQLDVKQTGDHGFGYDSMFIPDGHEESFGVLPPSIKEAISHRSRAVAAALETWGEKLAKITQEA